MFFDDVWKEIFRVDFKRKLHPFKYTWVDIAMRVCGGATTWMATFFCVGLQARAYARACMLMCMYYLVKKKKQGTSFILHTGHSKSQGQYKLC